MSGRWAQYTYIISIHAPPRGATRARGRVSVTCKFQFTPLREGRPTSNVRHILPFDFNSRPSARGDVPAACASASTAGISIHAPPRGATCREVRAPRPCHFNSRPSARGDQRLAKVAFGAVISIHAPPRGATPTPPPPRKRFLFQFTPLREGRPVSRKLNAHTE